MSIKLKKIIYIVYDIVFIAVLTKLTGFECLSLLIVLPAYELSKMIINLVKK